MGSQTMGVKFRNFFFALAFLVSLYIGFSIGKIIKEGQDDYLAVQSQTASYPYPSLMTEKTILIAGVETLETPRSVLESAWLLSYQEDIMELKLTPLYPVAETAHLFEYLGPHPPIMVSTENLDEFKTLPVLTGQGVSWDDVILIDEYALNMIIETTSAVPNLASPKKVAQTLEKAWIDPDKTLAQQKNIITYLCSHPKPFGNLESIQNLLNLIPNHIHTTLTEDYLLSQWQFLTNSGFPLECNFSWE